LYSEFSYYSGTKLMILFETTKSKYVIKGEIKMKRGCKSFDFLLCNEKKRVDYQLIAYLIILIFV